MNASQSCVYKQYYETQWKFFFVCVCVFCLFRAVPAAYRVSQARGLIRAVVTGLCQSHSNKGSEPRVPPVPQLTATPDP